MASLLHTRIVPKARVAHARVAVLPWHLVPRPLLPQVPPDADASHRVCATCARAVLPGRDARCRECGGSLEDAPHVSRGPPPPPPPRRLTRAQRAAVLRPKWASQYWMGTFFLALGTLVLPVALAFLRPLLLMAGIFLVVGVRLRRSGWPSVLRRAQRRRLHVLRWGLGAPAELTQVERHSLPGLEAGRVARLDYVFLVHGQPVPGSVPSSRLADARRPPGEPVWAVYLAESPDVSALWPPES
ncbi:hypothetical protein JY651_44050 [Pyxidicoccus parkwayensis]|uniref:Uncharacterized protein n=1 Tax=Pyxidicoccus parkwayensis TaxID=2813578 RepID=A0ABX7NUJ1_9BACT|nr:hypothetical protein [Pyxidicoccus parkwaysis]QSQ22044.1 hypothetical protein JY651_44050 [Pyxidicoccus parkwaysis]